ncbi:MAG: response regulator [Alistipes sp.]|nr:response regulator [Alistipes sp.]
MSHQTIVIYSEHSSTASLIAAILSTTSARIVCCSSSEQAIVACLREHPSIIIALSVTPFIDGTEFISLVRSRGKSSPAVYVVAWHQSEQTVLSLLECGVDQYMTFPICMGRLRMKAEAQLNTRSRL